MYDYQPYSNWFLLIAFGLNVLTTAFLEFINTDKNRAVVNDPDSGKGYGVYALVFCGVIFVALASENKRCEKICFTFLQIFFVSLPYYFGDNYYDIMKEYGDSLDPYKCEEECQRVFHFASLMLLGIAAIAIYPIKMWEHWNDSQCCEHCVNIAVRVPTRDKSEFWYRTTNIITSVIKTDIIYTTILSLGLSCGFKHSEEDVCDPENIACGCLVFFGCCLIGTAMVISTIRDIKTKYKSANCETLVCITAASLTVLFLYLLSDDQFPLEFILCAMPMNSTTGTESEVPRRAISGVRGVISLVCCLVTAVLSVAVARKYCKKYPTHVNSTDR